MKGKDIWFDFLQTSQTKMSTNPPKEVEISESKDVNIEIRGNQSATNSIIREWHGRVGGGEITQLSVRKRQIEKVPPLLLKGEKGQGNRDYYKPAVVSLGPYHHNRDIDLSAAENFKLITLEQYCLSCGNPPSLLYHKVLEVVLDARKCYLDGSTDEYNDEQFNRMMVHDGCFVLFFIDCFATQNEKFALFNEYLGAVGVSNIVRDIFLLENQIPFIVLQVLLDLRFPKDRGEKILNTFFNFLNYSEITTREETVLGKEQTLHLLELYRSYYISFSWSFGLGSKRAKKMSVDGDKDLHYVKPLSSVTELKAKGIFVRCATYDKSSNEEIKFHSRCLYGKLEFVRRAVAPQSHSKAIYLNMIAYEMCPHNPNDFRISTYIQIMKSLVIHQDDAKELRNNGVLLYSGRHEELVKMYDEIDAPVYNIFMFNQLRLGIHKHCSSKYKTWAAELINVYFTSPWKTVALLVATAILITSFLQTFFTIRPTSG